MYNFFVDVLIWSFAIFGMITLLQEFGIDMICYVCSAILFLIKRKQLRKKKEKYIM